MTTLDQARAVAQRLRDDDAEEILNTTILEDAADTIDALVAEVERLKEELAEVEATSERRLIKINEGQKCVGEWIAQHAQLNRDTAIQIAALRTENERMQKVLTAVIEAYPLGRVADAARAAMEDKHELS